MVSGPTLDALAERLARRQTTSEALVEECLARIVDTAGEGARTFLHVATDRARAAAQGMDRLRKAGAAPSRFAGIPVSIKDLFDIEGEVTRAGSRVLEGSKPAERDAVAVQRLKQAGFVVIGRTNMTEFAFSGVGVNPHYGTPLNVWDRGRGRIPGGSSSGAAISVADGMAHAALGTDTGGSCRIPAAFNGIVGYKPTAGRVPLQGAWPLSSTLDSIGPLARSVRCCASVDAILAGEADDGIGDRDAASLRILAPKTYLLDDLDADVARRFEEACSRLAKAGAKIVTDACPEIDEIPRLNAKGGFPAPECYFYQKDLIKQKSAFYDPRVLVRVMRGTEQSAVDYVELIRARSDLIERFERRLNAAAYDFLMFPTVPIVAPPIAAFDEDADFARLNALILRNPSVVNFLDGCAISIPVARPPDAPVGLTLAAAAGRDRSLFTFAAAVERALQAR